MNKCANEIICKCANKKILGIAEDFFIVFPLAHYLIS